MTFEQWRRQRVFYPTKSLSQSYREKLGLPAAMSIAPSDVIIMYPDMTFIEIVNGEFQLSIDEIHWESMDLDEVEKILWDNKSSINCKQDFEEEVENVFKNGDAMEIGHLYAHHLIWSLTRWCPPTIKNQPEDLITYKNTILEAFSIVFLASIEGGN